MTNEEVLLKVKKLLALSGSSFEAEAASAAAKATELMLAHGLQADQLVCEAGEEEEVQQDEYVSDKHDTFWTSTIARALAASNMCDHWLQSSYRGGNGRKRKHNIVFVGKPSRTVVCKEILQYLIGAVERILEDKIKEAKREGVIVDGDNVYLVEDFDRSDWLPFRNAFKIGAAENLAQRIKEETARRKTEGIKTDDLQVNALVVQNAYEVASKQLDAFRAGIHFVSGRGSSAGGGMGRGLGNSAGNSISLNKQVSGGRQRSIGM